MPWQVMVWISLFAIGGAFQIQSVARRDRWGMLTNSVRWLRARMVGRLVIFPLWAWLTWHWFLAPRSWDGHYADDIVAVLVGVAIALLADYQDYRYNPKKSD